MDDPEKKQDINTSVETKETSEKETETFTKEQVAEIREKASNTMSEAGRIKKEAEAALTKANAAEARYLERVKEADETELEIHRDDTDKLTEIRRRQTERRRDSELDERERKLKASEDEHAETLKTIAESTKEQKAREIATRVGVEAKTLIKLAKFTDGSPEAIEDIAKDLPQKGEPKDPLKPDSSKTIGGSASFAKIRDEMIKNPSNDAKMKRYMEAKKALEG